MPYKAPVVPKRVPHRDSANSGRPSGSGQVGEAAANAIPIDATFSRDFRLVPDETPEAVRAKVAAFLKSKGWTIVTGEPDLPTRLAHARMIRFEWRSGYPAFRSDMSTPLAKAVIATASEAARYPVAVLPMMGAGVPIYLFADLFKCPCMGCRSSISTIASAQPMEINVCRTCGMESRPTRR
jgi:acetylornithine deacetylase/succinyl-diaminopimelate desuccinylase-like protein